MAWQYFNPEFEYEQMLDNAVSSWAGHRFFAFDIISNFKPKTVVELGTWHGTSFFSFCQGAKNNSPETKLYAIDSWQGDPHTGEYGEEIFAGFQKIINTHSLSLANFVGCVVGFLNVCIIRLVASSLPPRYPLKAKWY